MKNSTMRQPRPRDPDAVARATVDARRDAARDPYAIGRASVQPRRPRPPAETCPRCGHVTAAPRGELCGVCQEVDLAAQAPSPEAIAALLNAETQAEVEEAPVPADPGPDVEAGTRRGPSIWCCGQFHPITTIPYACPACGNHLLGDRPPTLHDLLQQECTTLDTAIAALQAQSDGLLRTLTRKRAQRSLLDQYLAVVTEEGN